MNLTITLPDEDAQALQARAKANGLSAEEYVRQVIERDLAPDWLRKSWSSAEELDVARLSMDEIEAEIAAARRHSRPGA